MEHYVGIDVSLEFSSVCVVDAAGKVVREAKVRSEPEALVGFLAGLGVAVTRVGLETRTTALVRKSRPMASAKPGAGV